MDIKRVGPGGSPVRGPRDDREIRKSDFPAAGERVDLGPDASVPAGVPPGFTRADLANEEKVDAAVRHCVDVAVRNAAEKVDGGLGESERAHLAEVLGKDPAFREQVVRYLDQVLK